MATQNNMKYNRKQTLNHQVVKKYDSCIENISATSKRDGCLKKDAFGSEDDIINVDKLETSICQKTKKQKEKTVDIAFVATSENEKSKTILVELRCNYKNLRNLSESEILEKIKHSKQILGSVPVFFFATFLIFNASRKNEAKQRIRRYFKHKSTIEVLDIKDLKQKFF